MLRIRFSHQYRKLEGIGNGNRAVLLQVFDVNHNDLAEAMVDYDTAYDDGNGTPRWYYLPKGRLLVLVFMTIESRRVFTTIRSGWSDNRRDYYHRNVGNTFEVVIEQP